MAFVEQDKERTFTMVFDKNYEALCLYAVKFTEDFLEAEISCRRRLYVFGKCIEIV